MRLQQLNAALWYDEAFSAWLADLSLYNLFMATLYDVHPPTYYGLLWGLAHTWGHSEIILRLPSVVAGVVLIWLVYRLACDLAMSQEAALIAAGLTALAPYQIYYSQEARFYMLQSLLLTAAAIGLIERRDWLLILGSLAAIYLHNVSLIFVACLFMVGFVWEHLKTKRLLNAGALIVLGYLPMAGFSLSQVTAVGRNYWIPPIQNPGRILSALDDLIFLMPDQPFVVSSLVSSMLLIMILVSLPTGLKTVGYTPIYLYLAFCLPLGALTLISIIWQPIILPRILAPLAPAYYLLIAWCVTLSHRRTILALASVAPLLLAILYGYLMGSFGRQPVDHYYLSLYDQLKPGDAIFHANPGSYLSFHYYRPDTPQYLWHQTTDLSRTLTPQTKAAMGIQQGDLEDLLCRHKRWWLIQFNNPVSSPAEIEYISHLAERYDAVKNYQIRSDATVEAWLYRIDPNCNELPRGRLNIY